MDFPLNHRQERVLWATIDYYIATAEPVGSKALVEEYNLDASPATIRNAMGYLEKAGLLYQPHTSAGRVPSDFGYRVYVDRYLAPSDDMARQVGQLLSDRLAGTVVQGMGHTLGPSHGLGYGLSGSHAPTAREALPAALQNAYLEVLLKRAAQLLAGLSGCIAMIAMPQPLVSPIRHIRLLPVELGQVMALVVTEQYETHSAIASLAGAEAGAWPDHETLDRELTILSNFLDGQLRDRPLADLAQLDWQELGREFDRYADLLRDMLAGLARRAQLPALTRIFIGGMAEVLRQPEFTELQQVQTLVRLLEEEQDMLWQEMAVGPEDDRRVRIRIGGENTRESLQTYTLISSMYGPSESPLGSLGILGPTRLDYNKAIAAVEATADYLSEAIAPA